MNKKKIIVQTYYKVSPQNTTEELQFQMHGQPKLLKGCLLSIILIISQKIVFALD